MKRLPHVRTGLGLVLLAALTLLLGSTQLFAQSDGPNIVLRTGSFNPENGEPALAAQNRATLAEGAEQTYLVQFVGPIREDWKAAAVQLGARLYDSIPEHAMLARMDSDTASRVESLNVVRWVGLYHPAYRYEPELANAGASLQASASITVTVQVLPDSDLDALTADITALGGTVLGQDANSIAGYIDALVAPGSIADIARLDGVVWINAKLPATLQNDVGGGSVMRVDDVRQELGLYGSGQIVGVADSGLDTGNLTTIHPDMAGRIVATECIGRPDPCDWSDPNGHGTHVAGSVLGDGSASGSNPATSSYTGSFAGAAPEAQLVMQALDNSIGQLVIPTDAGDLLRSAYAEGARIHTNSWGGPTGQAEDGSLLWGDYTAGTQQFDTVMWENSDLLVLAAIGNSGVDADNNGVIDPGQVADPAGAKNILTVGASENNRPSIPSTWEFSGYANAPFASDPRADNIDGMAAFSSRGPTTDGRIKPEVVAPGTYIVSLRTRAYAFDDDLEGSLESYQTGSLAGGQTAPWQIVSDARSGSQALNQTVSGTFADGAASIVFTPPFNAASAGPAFDLAMWHTYSLSGDDVLGVALFGPDINDPAQTQSVLLALNFTGAQATYTPAKLRFSIGEVVQSFGINPTQLQIGFFIGSGDASFNSSWTIDDLRIDGAEWANMNEVGLAEPWSELDLAYTLQGGTSMSTPLTAGSAALVREWLIQQGETTPSGALMKAVLLNGAVDMSPGQYGTGAQQEIPAAQPNAVNGWGRVDVLNSLRPGGGRDVWYADEQTGVSTGTEMSFNLSVGASAGVAATLPEGRLPGTTLDTPALGDNVPLPAGRALLGGLREGEASLSAAPGAMPAQSSQELIVNGGFEEATAWAGTGGEQGVAYTELDARTGSRSLVFAPGADNNVFQSVTFPQDLTGATLSFAWKDIDADPLTTNDPLDGDLLQVVFCNPNDGCATNFGVGPALFGSQGAWQQVTLTVEQSQLASLAGQTIDIVFFKVQDGAAPNATFFLDDVSLQVTTGGGEPNPSPTPVPNPSPTPVPNPSPTPVPSPGPGPGPTPGDGESLRVTLVWTDYPGNPAAAKALVNDLDLEVVAADGTRYYGNQGLYSSGQCLRSSADACNPVETVLIPQAAAGNYEVIVRGYEVSQGGTQPFAIVASGVGLNDGGSNPNPTPGGPGDCNADQTIDAGDINAVILRVLGLDFLTSSGCDANEDSTIDAGDVSCTVLRAFGQTCSAANPAPNPGATQELIVNGGFEDAPGWTFTSDVQYTTTEAHSGSRSLMFAPGATNSAIQSVTFPENLTSATLTFAWKDADPDSPTSIDPLDGDVLQVVLCNLEDDCVTDYGYSPVLFDSQGAWQQVTLNVEQDQLAALAGQTIGVVLFKFQDDTPPGATFYVDDVSLQVTTSGGGIGLQGNAGAPTLHIGSATAAGSSVALPVSLDSGEAEVSSIVFTIDYDEARLAFDPTDADGDGVPDALRLTTTDGFDLSSTVDVSKTDGEIAISLGDLTLPLAALPDGEVISLTFDHVGQTGGEAEVRVADVSFGTPQGSSIAGGSTSGSVRPANSFTLYLPLIQR